MGNIIKDLEELEIKNMYIDEPLSKHTTLGIGGPADVLVYPESDDQLRSLLMYANKHHIDLHYLGKGSNLLISDQGLRGITLKFSRYQDTFDIHDTTVRVGAGYSLIKFATLMSRQGLSGLEFAGGIPGTIGGAIRMNAGAHGADISTLVKTVRVMNEQGEIIELDRSDLEFSYRYSILHKKPWILLDATFDLSAGEPQHSLGLMKELKEKRMKTQPLKEASCGSVFKNPLPDYAGDLIERCHLKGTQIGHAQISLLHANFIVNLGGATAQDVKELIHLAQEKVFNTFNVTLIPEVKCLGMELEGK